MSPPFSGSDLFAHVLDSAARVIDIWHMENTASQHRGDKVARPRGRPARISRDMILDAAAKLAEGAPGTLPSLNGIARALKISPMAIYTYFSGKDELLQALSDKFLAGFTLDVSADAEAFDVVVAWANAMRRHILAHPQVMNVLSWDGGHTSVAWLERGMTVSQALARAGFAGEGLAKATFWVWHVVMGAINVELHNRALPQDPAPEEMASLDPATRAQVETMLIFTSQANFADEFFAYQLDRMCEGLRAMHKNTVA